ncbi:MAG: hypothetical protein ACOCR0_02860, partial [Haloferacaceae archaeon]
MTTVEHETVSLGEFEFECGETLDDLRVAYEAYGEFDPEGSPAAGDRADASNAVLICHALTGSQNVANLGSTSGTAGQARAWWNDIVGPGKAIDTTEYYVV